MYAYFDVDEPTLIRIRQAVAAGMPSAVQSIAATDLSFNAHTTEVRVLALERSNEVQVVVETAVLSGLAPAGIEILGQQLAAPSGAPQLSPSVVVANPPAYYLSNTWAPGQPPHPAWPNLPGTDGDAGHRLAGDHRLPGSQAAGAAAAAASDLPSHTA
jgi:hypothetical protein